MPNRGLQRCRRPGWQDQPRKDDAPQRCFDATYRRQRFYMRSRKTQQQKAENWSCDYPNATRPGPVSTQLRSASSRLSARFQLGQTALQRWIPSLSCTSKSLLVAADQRLRPHSRCSPYRIAGTSIFGLTMQNCQRRHRRSTFPKI